MTAPREKAETAPPGNFVFLLAPQFSMIAFAAALEPLRLANRVSARPLYRWKLIGEGAQARCSAGVPVALDAGLEALERGTTIVICAGLDAHRGATRPVLTWLRREARLGARVAGLCTGARIMAAAGLLEGKRCTIHWENHAAFAEQYPDIELTNRLYELDGERMTCAGGAAAADMMAALIARDHGPELVELIADQMILSPLRGAAQEQRLSAPARIGVRHPKLIGVLARMEECVEEPLSPSELAAEVGISTRQLERLFRRYLGKSPKRYGMELRLARARRLLTQTRMSVIEVALASGFASPSHFSKCYRAEYGRTPYRERGAPE